MEATYRQPHVHRAIGCSPRQLVQWSVALWGAAGKGNHRRFTVRDASALRIVMLLRDMGASVDEAAQAAQTAVGRGVWERDERLLFEVERPHVSVELVIDLPELRRWVSVRLVAASAPGVPVETPAPDRSHWKQLQLVDA